MKRRKFSREFQAEAIKLVRERGVSIAQAGRDLDVHENVLRKWAKEFGADPAQAFPGHGQMKPEQQEIERQCHAGLPGGQPTGLPFREPNGHAYNAVPRNLFRTKVAYHRAEPFYQPVVPTVVTTLPGKLHAFIPPDGNRAIRYRRQAEPVLWSNAL